MSILLLGLLILNLIELSDLSFLLLEHALHGFNLVLMSDKLVLLRIRCSFLVLKEDVVPRFGVLNLVFKGHVIGLKFPNDVIAFAYLFPALLDFFLQCLGFHLLIMQPLAYRSLLMAKLIHCSIPSFKVLVHVIDLGTKPNNLLLKLGDLDRALLERRFRTLDIGFLV